MINFFFVPLLFLLFFSLPCPNSRHASLSNCQIAKLHIFTLLKREYKHLNYQLQLDVASSSLSFPPYSEAFWIQVLPLPSLSLFSVQQGALQSCKLYISDLELAVWNYSKNLQNICSLQFGSNREQLQCWQLNISKMNSICQNSLSLKPTN